jgi:hypothetical protein
VATPATPATPKKGRGGRRPPWYDKFLQALASAGNVLLASKAAGVDRVTAYRHRDKDPGFAAEWATAVEESADVLEAEAWRRAARGTDKPVYHKGKKVDTVKEYSDVLLIFLLKGNRPGKFRDNPRATAGDHPQAPLGIVVPDFDDRPIDE